MEIVAKIKEFLMPGAFHFTLAALLGTARFLWEPAGLPRPETLVEVARMFFEQYGLIALFVAAFIESLFMVSFYFPGSFVVVLAILVSDRSFFSLAVIVLIGWASVLSATIVNYWLGKEGFYRLLLRLGSETVVERMQAWLDKRGHLALFLSAMHPNLLAIATICMGIARAGLRKTLLLSFVALLFWIPLQVYLLGFVLPNPLENTALLYAVVVAGLIIWGGFLVVKEYRSKGPQDL